jgi:regulatory protein
MSQAIRSKAIRLLARRERSRSELQRLLDPEGVERERVSALLDELQLQGWLSEARFAQQLVNGRRSRSSAARVRLELKRRGLEAEVIVAATEGLEASDLPTATALWQRRFGEVAADRAQRERQMRFLLNRGFSRSIALKVVLSASRDECPDIDEETDD